jgi:hypothetical protein
MFDGTQAKAAPLTESVSLPVAEILLTGSPQFVAYQGMAEYKLVLDELAVFVVDIVSTSGRRSMRRFPTEAAASTWIAEQEFRVVAAETAKGADVNQSSASLS